MYKRYIQQIAVLSLVVSHLAFAGAGIDSLPTGNKLYRYSSVSNQETFKIEIPDLKNSSMTEEHVIFKSYYLNQSLSRLELNKDINMYLDKIEREKDENKPIFKLGKDARKALKHLMLISDEINESYVRSRPDFELMEKAFEITDSINLNYKIVILPRIRIGNIFSLILGSLNSKSGERPQNFTAIDSSSEIDPVDSTFWQKPANISNRDTVASFDRSSLPDYSNTVFEYDEPKTGRGMHPGFRVKLDGVQYKIRMGKIGYASRHRDSEFRVASFSTRILYALGYNSLPIDRLDILKVKYDRRLLSEYNMRAGIPLEVGFGKKFNLVKTTINPYLSPFENIYRVVLKDGQIMSAKTFKQMLFDSKRKKVALDSDRYDVEFEKQIKELHYKHVSIEKIDDNFTSVGPWDWNSPRHIEHKELRGYALLAAWLGQYDARVDNTRMYLIKDEKNNRILMRHYISDVGSGLGSSNPFFNADADQVKKMRNEVLKVHPKDPEQVISTGFQTVTTNKTFESMNVKDAKWMLGYIDQLTESQIRNALRVSGYDQAEEDAIYLKLMLRKENIRQVIEQVYSNMNAKKIKAN